MKWEKVKLEDCCLKIGSGSTPKGGSTVYIDNGVTLIRSQNVYNLKFEYDGLAHITDEAAQKLSSVNVQEDDVLLNITGDSIARTCIVPTKVLPARVNQHVAIVRPNPIILNARFLNYYLVSPYMQAFMLSLSVGKGASRNAMTKEMIENYEIPCPPIGIQNRIADILSAYDDLIENNRKQIKLLEEAAQRLYKEWFVDLRFPGYEHTKIVDGVPEGWKKSTTAAVSSVLRRGISPYYNEKGKSVVINQKCIRQTVVDFNESRRQEKPYPEEMNLQDSDTVICSTGSGTLGRVGQIFGDCPDATFDSHVTLVRAKEGFGKQYLFQSLKARQTYLMGMGKGSTNQLELSRGTIQDLDIYVPPKKVLDQFEQIAQPIHDKISIISNSIIQLQTARDCLLPKLMSGEMEV